MPSHFVQFESAKANPDLPGVQDIDPQELLQKLDSVVLVDVRQPPEFTGELGHIPGAQLVVLDTLPAHVGDLPTDKTVVFVCLSGGRSARATHFAKDNGLTSAYNLKGGMKLWNQLNYAVKGRNEN